MKTRVFKSGNSQAVRIPAEIAYRDDTAELEISRHGDLIMIRPVAAVRSMKEALDALQRLPRPDRVEVIERTRTRDTLDDR
ncbi:MAG: AbrB/MazE/SpoVT family DNA-binding domain-containing protein [Rhizomicrobium sp.]